MKKIVSYILVLSLLFSLAQPAVAANSSHNTEIQNATIEKIDNGYVFFQNEDVKRVIIISNVVTNSLNVAISYTEEPNVIHQWIIDDYPDSDLDYDSAQAWLEVVRYAEENMQDSFSTVMEWEPANDPDVGRASAGSDLRNALKAKYGSEYSDKKLRTEIKGGAFFTVYESKSFEISKQGTLTWGTVATVAGILLAIYGYFNEVALERAIGILLGFFGVATSDAPVKPNSLNYYNCYVLYTRYVMASSSDKQWSTTYKTIRHTGFENPSLDSNDRAALSTDTGSTSITYAPDEAFFDKGLVDDAYRRVYG